MGHVVVVGSPYHTDNVTHTAYKAGGKPTSTTFSSSPWISPGRSGLWRHRASCFQGFLSQVPTTWHREEGNQYCHCCPRDSRGCLLIASTRQTQPHPPSPSYPLLSWERALLPVSRLPSRPAQFPCLLVSSTASPPYLEETSMFNSPTFSPVSTPGVFCSGRPPWRIFTSGSSRRRKSTFALDESNTLFFITPPSICLLSRSLYLSSSLRSFLHSLQMGSFIVMLLRFLEVVTVGKMTMFAIMSTTVIVVGTPEKDQGLLSYGMDYIKVSLTILCSNDASIKVVFQPCLPTYLSEIVPGLHEGLVDHRNSRKNCRLSLPILIHFITISRDSESLYFHKSHGTISYKPSTDHVKYLLKLGDFSGSHWVEFPFSPVLATS